MIERSLLYAAELAVAAVGRVRSRAGRFMGLMATTREVASRAYVEFLTNVDEESEWE
jgi:hypothetical protein